MELTVYCDSVDLNPHVFLALKEILKKKHDIQITKETCSSTRYAEEVTFESE